MSEDEITRLNAEGCKCPCHREGLWKLHDEILHKWIPVDEQLPEKKCIATYLNSHDKHRTIIAVYVPRFIVESSGEADDYDEYLANTDMYYFKEGWYECQENWGEYAMIYVNEGDVSHWMPLPPPPQENEDA